jgi:hypothetical protein
MFHIHWFKTVKMSWKYDYQKCRCGKRRCIDALVGYGNQPKDEEWLKNSK